MSHRQTGTSSIGPNNQLLSDGEFTYQYDDEGNLLHRTEIATGDKTEYVYDHRNRLLRVTEKTSTGTLRSESTYRYDVLGRRVEKIENGRVTKTLYDGDNAWIDADSANNVKTWYLFDDSQYDENIARYDVADGAAWYLADKLGSITTVVNMQHTFVASAYYDSFGNILATTNAATLDRFAFAGRELDLTGLYHNRARAYNPATSVFIQQDPLGFEGRDANLYRYVANSVLNAKDPSGRVALSEYVTSTKIIAAVKIGAGALGCFLGDLSENDDEGPGPADIRSGKIPGRDNVGETVIRAGVFFVVAKAIELSLAAGTRSAAAVSPLASGVLTGQNSFIIGVVVCRLI